MEELKEPEKTTRWSETELTGGREATDYVPTPPPLPKWLTTFPTGTIFNVNGWDCAVRHVGEEEGHWLMLVEPVRCTERLMSRSEYRRLKGQLGKKKVEEILKERGQAIPVTLEEHNE